MRKPTGMILFEGPSLLDGSPIVVIATLKTSNRKTGDMVQTWIIRADMSPVMASKSLMDGAVCGSCPHRQSLGGSCYVNLGQGPRAIYEAYRKGRYPVATPELLEKHIKGRYVRLGAYGDPAAAPYDVWNQLVQLASGHTGYTHQVKHRNFDPRMADLCMVSADTPKQAAAYHDKGWRTFRVKTAEGEPMAGEVECLADSQGMSCADCRACDGATTGAASIFINVHGALSSRYENKFANANLIAVA